METFYSLRIVEAETHAQAIEKVIAGDFNETPAIADKVLTQDEILKHFAETSNYALISLYAYDELPTSVKHRVVRDLADINVSHNWWEDLYADAKEIGLELLEFDLDRNKHVKGNLLLPHTECAKLIQENHGLAADLRAFNTRRRAEDFLHEINKLDESAAMLSADDSEGYDNLASARQDLEIDFKNDLLECYADMLQKGCDYLMSDEAIIETIKANEYTFEITGKMRNI